MLRLLLDEHISPVVARELRARHPELFVVGVQEWQGGIHLGLPDGDLLTLAREEGLTLVTYDLRTIAPLLKRWAESGTAHGGVIFVDGKTVAPNDFGTLVRSLASLWHTYRDEAWTDWVFFLSRSEQ